MAFALETRRGLLYLQNNPIFLSSSCFCFCCSGVRSGRVKVIVDGCSFLNFAYLSFFGFTFFFLFLFLLFFPISIAKTLFRVYLKTFTWNSIKTLLWFFSPYICGQKRFSQDRVPAFQAHMKR